MTGSREDWHVERQLGHGAQSRVYFATGMGNHRASVGALKVSRLEEDRQNFTYELGVMRQNRMGVPRLIDENEAERWIVMELFPRGSLEDNVRTYESRPHLALLPFLFLIRTVASLHACGIHHGDIKLSNVLLRTQADFILGDFGSACPHSSCGISKSFVGDPADADVYALGKLFWSMITGGEVLFGRRLENWEPDLESFVGKGNIQIGITAFLKRCLTLGPMRMIPPAAELGEMVSALLIGSLYEHWSKPQNIRRELSRSISDSRACLTHSKEGKFSSDLLHQLRSATAG